MSINPIDAVIIWVDGDSPDFIKSKEALFERKSPNYSSKWTEISQYTGAGESRENFVSSSYLPNSFRNMDELRYLLRSLEKFAPWFRRIHLVTNGQIPSWIDQSNSKLRIVTHSEIFPDEDASLSFNAHAIEFCLSRIPGLSKDFIYFNNDTLLGSPVNPLDFKTEKNQYKMFAEPGKTLPITMSDRSLISHIWAYNHNLIIEHFGESSRRMFAHTPQMYNRQHLEVLHLLWPEEIEQTIRNRFRTPFDAQQRLLFMHYSTEVEIDNSIHRHEIEPMGIIVDPPSEEYCFVRFGESKEDYMLEAGRAILLQPKFICLRDEIKTNNENQDKTLRGIFHDILGELLPDSSKFEKRDLSNSDVVQACEENFLISSLHLVSINLSNGNLTKKIKGINKNSIYELESFYLPKSEKLNLDLDSTSHNNIWLTVRASRMLKNFFPERGHKYEFNIKVNLPIDATSNIDINDIYQQVNRKVEFIDSTESKLNEISNQSSRFSQIGFQKATVAIRQGCACDGDITQLQLSQLSSANDASINYNILLAALQTKNWGILQESLRSMLKETNNSLPTIESLLVNLKCANRINLIEKIVRKDSDWLNTSADAYNLGIYYRAWVDFSRGRKEIEYSILLKLGVDYYPALDLWTDIIVETASSKDLDIAYKNIIKLQSLYKENSAVAISRLRINARRAGNSSIHNNLEILSFIRKMIGQSIELSQLLEIVREAALRGDVHFAQSMLDDLRNHFSQSLSIELLQHIIRDIAQEPVTVDEKDILESKEVGQTEEFWLLHDKFYLQVLKDLDTTEIFSKIMSYPNRYQNIQSLVLSLENIGRIAQANAILGQLEEYMPLDVSFVQRRIEIAIEGGVDDAAFETLLSHGDKIGMDRAQKGMMRTKYLLANIKTKQNTPDVKNENEVDDNNIVLVDSDDMKETELRSQIYLQVLEAANKSVGWLSDKEEPTSNNIAVSLKLNTPSDVFLMFDVADRRTFDQTDENKLPYVQGFQKIMVIGEWHKDYITNNKSIDFDPDNIFIVGSPRIDYLRAQRKKHPAADDSDQRKVLFAPLHNHWKDSKGAPMSCSAEMEPFIEHLGKEFDLSVMTDPRQIVRSKEPITQELLDASVVITDYTSLIYEAWCLGKPVIFPRWLMGDRILDKAPRSAEAQIYRENIGLHASSFDELVYMIKSAEGVDEKIEAFMASYIDNYTSGNSASKIAYLLEGFANPSQMDLLEENIDTATKLVEAGKHDEAEDILRKTISFHSNELLLYLKLAESLIGQERWSDAVRELHLAVEVDQDSARLFELLGETEVQRQNQRAAADAFNKAVNILGNEAPVSLVMKLALAHETPGKDGPEDLASAFEAYKIASTL